MSLRAFLERVIASGLLQSELVVLAERGATAAELEMVPGLPPKLRELLMWQNGLDLDIVRIHGVGPAVRQVERFSDRGESDIVFASDPAGFLYALQTDGSVLCLDSDGGESKLVAADLDNFLCSYIFGARAHEFGGGDWEREAAVALGEG